MLFLWRVHAPPTVHDRTRFNGRSQVVFCRIFGKWTVCRQQAADFRSRHEPPSRGGFAASGFARCPIAGSLCSMGTPRTPRAAALEPPHRPRHRPTPHRHHRIAPPDESGSGLVRPLGAASWWRLLPADQNRRRKKSQIGRPVMVSATVPSTIIVDRPCGQG